MMLTGGSRIGAYFRWGLQLFSAQFDPARGTAARAKALSRAIIFAGSAAPRSTSRAAEKRFVMVERPDTGAHDSVAIVLNWFETWSVR